MIAKFSNLNLREQAIRILGRNYLYLPKKYAFEFEDYLKRINPADENQALLNYKGEPRLTPVAALQEITELKNSKLDDLEKYILDNYVK